MVDELYDINGNYIGTIKKPKLKWICQNCGQEYNQVWLICEDCGGEDFIVEPK